jgi:hypothetical protein
LKFSVIASSDRRKGRPALDETIRWRDGALD